MKTRKGATSFYVVAFSTLILVIIAASFTAVVLSEMARTANDDLSQSAYDSALAGIEDAKLAFYNYQKCLGQGAAETVPINDGRVECGEIIYWVNHSDCDMVAKILGRVGENENREVIIEESTSGGNGQNNLQQAYTCVEINTKLSDYRSSLTESDTTRVVRIRLGLDENGNQIHAKDIEKVKVSWFAEEDRRSVGQFEARYSHVKNGGVVFPSLKNSDTDLAVPPMISVGLVQTANTFSFDQFDSTSGGTNRGTLFLVPTGELDGSDVLGVKTKDQAYNSDTFGNYISAYTAGVNKENTVSKDLVVKSNDRKVKNLPISVYCDTDNSEFACSTMIELPDPVGGTRSDDTFMFVVSLPYGKPSASFSLELYCKASVACGQEVVVGDSGETEQKPAVMEGMQIEIDSTGRANNLYRRVSARMDSADSYFPYPLYALELLGSGSDSLLQKPGVVTCEWDFDRTGPCD